MASNMASFGQEEVGNEAGGQFGHETVMPTHGEEKKIQNSAVHHTCTGNESASDTENFERDHHDNSNPQDPSMRDYDIMSLESVESFSFSASDTDSGSDSEAEKNIRQSRSQLYRRFDTDLVVQSIQRGESTLDQIKNRDCVLIVGKTGTGKSTLIQAIAGKKIHAKTQTVNAPSDGITHSGEYVRNSREKVVYEAMDPLPGFEIGHEKVSKTTSIGCYDYNPNELGLLEGGPMMFVDSPGFEDTSGHEADVATSILLSQVARHSRSLRFVILISYVSLIDDRGGPIRSVLRLIRNFVKDFDKEKQSFMFLFTHCNEIQGVPDEIEGAKKCLYEEINQIMKGTDDEDTKEVLKHVKTSLKKGYPFVDVFLPLQSNVPNLVKFVHKHLKPIKEPHIANHCGLTQSSRLTLGGELQNRLQELHRDLSSISIDDRDPPMHDICAAFQMFDYFHQYINIEDTRDAMEEAIRMLEAFVKDQTEIILSGVQKGTESDQDFGSAHLIALRGALSRLQVLQEILPNIAHCDEIEREMSEKLDGLYRRLIIGEGESFLGLHRDLSKLALWSTSFAEYVPIYTKVKHHLGSLVEESINKCNGLDTGNILDLPREKLRDYVEILVVLSSIAQSREYLIPHGLHVQHASDAYELTVASIESYVQSLKKEAVEILKQCSLDDETLRKLGSLNTAMVDFNVMLTQSRLCPKLKKSVEDFGQQFSENVIEYFEALVAEIRFDGTDQPEMIKKVLIQTRVALGIFNSIGDSRFSQLSIIYEITVHKTRDLLMKQVGELKQITLNVEKQGIKDGVENARMMCNLGTVCWFDSFLPDNSKFVMTSYMAIKYKFINRMKNLKAEVGGILRHIAEDDCDSELPVQTLKSLLLELGQVSKYMIGMNFEGSRMEEEERGKFVKIVKAFIDKHQECIAEWRHLVLMEETVDMTMTQVDIVTGKLERFLRKINALQGLDNQCDSHLDPVFSHTITTLHNISNHFKDTMKTSEEYEKKFRLLQIAHAIAKFSHVSKHVVEVRDLEEDARNTVASDAKKIEDLISQSSEWDELDSLLTRFQAAVILDVYIQSEATSRISPLMKLREKKQDEVDQLLDKMILVGDFKGIGDFLSPYAESKDQVKNQQFNKWLEKISLILSESIKSVHRNIEGDMTHSKSEKIVMDLHKLEHAQKQVDRYLVNAPGGLDLEKEIDSLKCEINENLQSLLADFEYAIGDLDFEAMGIKNHFIQAHTLLMEQKYVHLKKVQKKKLLQEAYKESKEEIFNSMNRYVQSWFQNGEDFFRVLLTLKNASESSSPQLDDLRESYMNVRKELTNMLNSAVESMSEQVANTDCYDAIIDVMNSVDQHLKCGLKGHIIDTQLSFNSGEKLKAWREEKRRIDCEMDFDGSDVEEKIRYWSTVMDKLDPSRNFVVRGINQIFLGESYKRRVDQIERIVSGRSDRGNKALKDGNYILTDECIKILDLVEDNLGKHVSHAGRYSRLLQQNARDMFVKVCDRARDVLQSENLMEIEVVFTEYRGLVLYTPCVMTDDECIKSFSLINQLIYNTLDRDIRNVKQLIDEFAFESVHNEIIRAREFGNFIADHCTLLKEEIRRCDHIQTNDKWLVEVFSICHEHYSCGRSFTHMADFALLELPPSASKNEVEKAYRRLSRKYHPDKNRSADASELFRSIAEAKDRLVDIVSSRDVSELPFGALIKDIPTSLMKSVKAFLDDQRYGQIERMLFALKYLKPIGTLVSPHLSHNEIIEDAYKLVASRVRQVRTMVKSTWSSRNYKVLNDTITDLRMMEEHFKAYEDIFPTSWNDGIVQSVQTEIQELGTRARQFLSSKKIARKKKVDFRSCFLTMGHVLFELQHFQAFTKTAMCDVLEGCLQHDWGYSYLFEFGLSLQRGDNHGNEDDNNIAQRLVAEFPHFKEVMIMVWNEETSQKPAEDTINRIKAQHWVGGVESELFFDNNQLLQNYKEFEVEYKNLLGKYISPGADLNVLANKIIELSESFQPLDIASGWNENLKSQIPRILASVFTIFTVLKSGASYNRLESTSDSLVLTLLSLFGCGVSNTKSTGLDSQLMQIRTGEGKSLILGVASVVLALLGFRVRCVCYSEYLSARDFNLFKDIFDRFGVTDFVKYSKITSLSEDATFAKGDIRKLTDALLRGTLENYTDAKELTVPSRPEILLVDEVDVFFGGGFYGQTYNQVTLFRAPEIAIILKHVWITHKRNGRRQRLVDIQALAPYRQLITKMPQFKNVIDAEISLMINQVRKLDEDPKYHFDEETNRIGYEVMDSISYEATYGYRTVFAYMREADRGKLRDACETLNNALAMPISCGQFSYAEIAPACILGVTGTLSALGDFEYNVLSNYGVNKYIYVPSVYGDSNFQFDKAGSGICIDTSESDYFHSITRRINELIKQKRAVIIFFENNSKLERFKKSPFYHKLGPRKQLLEEKNSRAEKEFIVNKATTAGQITISTAVFGRGTDFFCKDDTVQRNGGVHVIQAFLSEDESEEIQIQGRTARQGKRGSYEMILLASDLEEKFSIPKNMKDEVAKKSWYQNLCYGRNRFRDRCNAKIKENLADATEKDKASHIYFDSLISRKETEAATRFKDLYNSFKEKHMPSSMPLDIAFLVDLTGSMAPYVQSVVETTNAMLKGKNSITEKLKAKYPGIKFILRAGLMGYRDVLDDKKIVQCVFNGTSHFTTDFDSVVTDLKSMCAQPSGGGDLAEDHLSAIYYSSKWEAIGDWTSPIKFMLLFTDAPAHGMVPERSNGVQDVDIYPLRHPYGLTEEKVIASLAAKEIDLCFCSFNPSATLTTERTLSSLYMKYPDKTMQREVLSVPMVPVQNDSLPANRAAPEVFQTGYGQHIIFVLDMSSSMIYDWDGVVAAYKKYLHCRRQNQSVYDLISVIQFDSHAQVTVDMLPIGKVPDVLEYMPGIGTCFAPAAKEALDATTRTPSTHIPIVVFMSDGEAHHHDAATAAKIFSRVNRWVCQNRGRNLELHVIAFRSGASTKQLKQIRGSSDNGKLYNSANVEELSNVFVEIAEGGNVTTMIEAEIGSRIFDAVSDRLSLEYLA